MGTDLSIVTLIANASVLVQLVMLLLLLASVVSWTVILKKRRAIKKADKQAKRFEKEFWSGGDLSDLYRGLNSDHDSLEGEEALFAAGFREFVRFRKHAGDRPKAETVDAIRRAMRVQLTREMEELENELPLLATIGSTSPYVGLFGTVWGIMNSFRALGEVQQATLAMVAPGIAEALIATAMGLFAAIPAVIFFNTLVSRVGRLESRYGNFVEEFTHILERHVYAGTVPEQK